MWYDFTQVCFLSGLGNVSLFVVDCTLVGAVCDCVTVAAAAAAAAASCCCVWIDTGDEEDVASEAVEDADSEDDEDVDREVEEEDEEEA